MADESEGSPQPSPPQPPPSGSAPGAGEPKPFTLQPTELPAPPANGPIDLLMDVPLNVRVELGRTKMYVEDILRLGDGAVVELDKLAGDPVDVLVNDKLVARGEVLVLNENFCVRITEIVDAKERAKT